MKSITKIRVVLVLIIIALVSTVCNAKQYQNPNEDSSNSLEMDTKRKIIDEIELKTSGDNKYKKVWDSGTTDLHSWALNIGDDINRNGKDEIIAGRDVIADYEVIALEYNETFENYTIVWNSGDISNNDIKAVCAGDQDGDGKKEIIAADEDGFLHIFEYNGTDYENVYKEYQGNDIQGMYIGDDCDNDGYNEIIIARVNELRILEYNKTDDGCEMTWQTSMTYTDNVISSDDLDGDGKKEIIANDAPGGKDMIKVFENIANNTFKQVWNSSNIIGGGVDAICIGEDLDDDGKKEIIVGAFDNKIYVFEYNGTDNGYNKTWDSKSIIGDNVRSVCIADDLDGDGKKEIIAAADNKIYIFEFNGTDNGFDKVWDSGTEITGVGLMNVLIGVDLDRNGKKEIVAGTFGGIIHVFEHDDTTSTSRPIIIIDEDDDDDDDDEDGIFISNQTLLIGGALSAVVLVAVVIILIKIKSGSGR